MNVGLQNHLIVAASGDAIATAIRGFISPLILLFIGVVALSFLMKKEITQFFQFILLAIGVGVFFYTPGVVEKLATVISNSVA